MGNMSKGVLAGASNFSSFVKKAGKTKGRSGSRTVSPGPGCPRGGGQLSWRTADAPRPWSWAPPCWQPFPREGGWALLDSAEAGERGAGPGASYHRQRGSVCAGGCAFGGGFSRFRYCLRTAGAGVSDFSPSPSSGGTPLGAAALPRGERAGPGSGARGLFTALSPSAAAVPAGRLGALAASRPLPAGRYPRSFSLALRFPAPPPRAAAAPCARLRRPPTRRGPAPLHPLRREPGRRARWGGPGEERGFACLSPAPLPPPLPQPIGAEGSAPAADAPEGAPLLK